MGEGERFNGNPMRALRPKTGCRRPGAIGRAVATWPWLFQPHIQTEPSTLTARLEKLDIHDTASLTRYAISAGIIEGSVQLTID